MDSTANFTSPTAAGAAAPHILSQTYYIPSPWVTTFKRVQWPYVPSLSVDPRLVAPIGTEINLPTREVVAKQFVFKERSRPILAEDDEDTEPPIKHPRHEELMKMIEQEEREAFGEEEEDEEGE